MITKTITVEIPAGLEVRPVAVLVQVANQYNSSIYVESGNKKVNAKSIMGLMTLGLRGVSDRKSSYQCKSINNNSDKKSRVSITAHTVFLFLFIISSIC